LNFVKVLSDKEHPFILFIDDLQWVDSASLGLLKSIMLDDEIHHLLIIGAYRDNEVDTTHPLMSITEDLKQSCDLISIISLSNLSQKDINRLIAETLKSELIYAQLLSDLIYEKTQGNAFFTHEFLKSLYQQGLLLFDLKTLKWQWNIDKIKALGMTSNVIALMTNLITQLPTKTIEALKLAACIGNQFELNTLSTIYQHSDQEILSDLWPAIKEGLLLPLDDNYKQLESEQTTPHFKFQHDRVQQAAYSLINEAEQQSKHLEIGRLLLANTKESEQQEKLFDIVNHFNEGMPYLADKLEKLKLAELNLRAGRKAKTASAYQPAFNYMLTGIHLLSTHAWQEDYELCLVLHNEAAETAFINSHFEEVARFSNIILQHSQTLLDQINAYQIQIQCDMAQNKMQQAIDRGLEVLEHLDIGLLETPPKENNIAFFYTLPPMTAPDKLAAMHILQTIFSSAYLANPSLLPSIVFTMLKLCIQYGNSPLAAYCYVVYGLLLCTHLNDIERGHQFGQLALDMLAQYKAIEIKCKVDTQFNVFIRHWKEHVRDTLAPFRETIQVGLETGDTQFTSYAVLNYCSNLFLVGESLQEVFQKQVSSIELLKTLKQEFQLNYAKIWGQLVLNFRNLATNKQILSGELFNETDLLDLLREKQNYSSLFAFYNITGMLNYFFKNHQEALSRIILAEEYAPAMVGTFVVTQQNFYSSLIRLAVSTGDALEKVANNQQQMKIWASHAPMNFQHKYDLVEAEKARVLGQDLLAIDGYEKAINGARENEYLHEEALAYELAAEFYLGRGMEKFARTYMKEAHYRYQQWGALAKVKDLEEKYRQFILPNTPDQTNFITSMPKMSLTSSQSTSKALDLDSVMKASQALSGEIVLGLLLEKMMHIVIENAGAEKGFFLLPQQEGWVTEAEGQIDSNDVKVLQSHPIENQPIAETIIHYVERTQENVVLNHATQDGQFTRDPYIKKQRPKSILCMPLVNQGQLTGILYLENNLTTGAFTPNRLEVLKVLCSQLAISIENALLYRTLEQKVSERTAELAGRTEQLAQANQEITALNKQLKTDNLRMSAELNVSRRLQKMLLPKDEELEAIDGLDIAGFMEPAEEVGGDYYDVLTNSGRILFAIGDVTGHGLESGALSIMIQSSIRTLLALNETDPVKFFSALNQMVYHNVQRMNVGKSLTLALVDYQDNQLYLSGQHEEMIVVRNGELELIDTLDLGFPIGLDEEIAEFVHQVTVPLNAGDVVVLYTDGITEAENLSNEYYGLERLCQVVQHNWLRTADDIQQAVIFDVRQFIGEQKVYDDITLLVLKQK
ncbi:MAG: SpoIIE family protein phosphatase, partial [Candidatus Parabeggiatoa sp.]|nr:SpoIIE family protein phosphatase [Candidatus Parabeggiatoa sp.]